MEIEIIEIYNKLIASKKYYYSFSNRIKKTSLKLYNHICVDLEYECFVLCTRYFTYDGENFCTWDTLYLKDYGKTWALTKEELVRKVRRND